MNRTALSTAAAAMAIPLLAGVILSRPARAAPISYGTGLASPALTIDFSGQGESAVLDSVYAGQGVTFTGLNATNALGSTLAPTTAPAAVNFLGGTTNATFTISFAVPVIDAAFFLYTDGTGTTITSSLGGATVETVAAGTYASSGADFFGFTGSNFDTITIAVSGSGRALIDNVQVGALAQVPEPASGGLLLMGVAGLAMMGARRRG